MPSFYVDDVDISVDEFLERCDDSEKDEIIDALIEDGYLPHNVKSYKKNNFSCRANYGDKEFIESIKKLLKCGDLLTLEEETYINNLAEKFRYIR
jgi:hypothetical protein